jgi:hypothetical protein
VAIGFSLPSTTSVLQDAIPARALMPDNQFLVGRYRERWQDYFLNHLSEEKEFL